MHWNEIEDQWIAMTRRIRSDWKDAPRRAPASVPDPSQGPDVPGSNPSADAAAGPGSRSPRPAANP